MDAKEFVAFLVSLIVSLGIIILIVAIGWFCVWKFFLCRFRLVRELLGTASENGGSSTSTTSTAEESASKANGRRNSRKSTTTKTTTTTTGGALHSTRSRSRKDD